MRGKIEEGYKLLVRRGGTTFDGSRVGIIGGGVHPADIGRQKSKRRAKEEAKNV